VKEQNADGTDITNQFGENSIWVPQRSNSLRKKAVL